MVYRRTIAEAPARRDEIAHTYEEDIEIRELTNPVSCYSKDGVLTGSSVRRWCWANPTSPAAAAPWGQASSSTWTVTTWSSPPVPRTVTPWWIPPPAIDKDKWGGIATDASGKTSRPGVFAGGDAVTGPQTVVKAMGAGKQAAVSIDAYLSGR